MIWTLHLDIPKFNFNKFHRLYSFGLVTFWPKAIGDYSCISHWGCFVPRRISIILTTGHYAIFSRKVCQPTAQTPFFCLINDRRWRHVCHKCHFWNAKYWYDGTREFSEFLSAIHDTSSTNGGYFPLLRADHLATHSCLQCKHELFVIVS